MKVKKIKIAFLHKALLFGGAERLILDMALSFKDQGHQTTIYTAEYEPEKTFPEFQDAGVTIKVANLSNSLESRCVYST